MLVLFFADLVNRWRETTEQFTRVRARAQPVRQHCSDYGFLIQQPVATAWSQPCLNKHAPDKCSGPLRNALRFEAFSQRIILSPTCCESRVHQRLARLLVDDPLSPVSRTLFTWILTRWLASSRYNSLITFPVRRARVISARVVVCRLP